jgi:hypothetical protein
MKYIKKFEELSKTQLSELIDDIKDYVEELTDDADAVEVDAGIFSKDISILHQQEYIDGIYESMYDHSEYCYQFVTLPEFRNIYNKILTDSREKIVRMVIENPSLYVDVLDNYKDLKIPDWVKKSKKYNI